MTEKIAKTQKLVNFMDPCNVSFKKFEKNAVVIHYCGLSHGKIIPQYFFSYLA